MGARFRPNRPTEAGSLQEAFKRIRALERLIAAAGIECAVENECEWFWLETTGEIPLTDNGIHLFAGNGKDFTSGTIDGGNYLIDVPGGGFQVDAGSFALLDAGVIVSTLSVNGIVIALLAAGGVIEFRDADGAPWFRMTDGSPDVHLQSGANIILDL